MPAIEYMFLTNNSKHTDKLGRIIGLPPIISK
jgi:hypothetical protein